MRELGRKNPERREYVELPRERWDAVHVRSEQRSDRTRCGKQVTKTMMLAEQGFIVTCDRCQEPEK